MAFARFDPKNAAAPMSDINMVPLIDVMLVLLVIFIVTAPLLTHAVRLELPRTSAPVDRPKPDTIDVAIDGSGALYWNGQPVTRDQALVRFAAAGAAKPVPQLHLRADQAVPYRFVARTIADASAAGLSKVGFVGEPEKNPAP